MDTKEALEKKIISYFENVLSKLTESVPYWDFRIKIRGMWEKGRKDNNFAGYDVLDDSPCQVFCPEPYLTIRVEFSFVYKWKGKKLSQSRWLRKKSDFQLEADKLFDSIVKKCEQADELSCSLLDYEIEGDDVEIPAEKYFYYD